MGDLINVKLQGSVRMPVVQTSLSGDLPRGARALIRLPFTDRATLHRRVPEWPRLAMAPQVHDPRFPEPSTVLALSRALPKQCCSLSRAVP